MSSSTTTATQTAPSSGTLRLRPDQQWQEDLRRDGWAVVKGVIPRERALANIDKCYEYIESFGLGFDRNDRSTWKPENMPHFYKGGLFVNYGSGHEQFIWDIKQDPAVVGPFQALWGTDELLASFDGFNLSLPFPDRPQEDFTPWPHVDQSPLVKGLHCVQGIMNISENGPDDGGLMVLKGSSALYTQLFEAFEDKKPAEGWNKHDRHDHTPEQIQWLMDHGCEYHKVTAEPGDLLLWDSRTVHYGAAPSSDNPRFASYVCYKPAMYATPEVLAKRKEAWDTKTETTHDPITFNMNARRPPDGHPTVDHPKVTQLQEPQLTELGKKLAGVVAW
ncbi:uncharacterized protein MKK02DRAFT_31126 [Dioszegia hungarica]|uniref:Phytanoyl-CoA dioxygenase n=1 Tax=Dioszegia hungarica TaxID=4972 RepID=A0AA38HFS4_9TREE|nr:uncharacterized protein MKK02DRAFT_31126 [Dioszegia hungarica]KAI9638809.1 hypothetical protein MKK02DRAFT_31126 [Dioszegia hungarica]